MGIYAPIVLFVYSRPDLTVQTIEYLKNNNIAQYSDLIIYSDHYKNLEDKSKVEQVRKLINNLDGFKSVTVYEASYNKGLASSIIEGVSRVTKEFGAAIVLEDDLLTSSHFLEYMNSALEYYADEKAVWSIAGYTPIKINDINDNKDVYFTGRASSWGWATWHDRWILNNWNINDYESIFKSREKQNQFNYTGNDMFPMLMDQKNKYINSWAIRWCFNQYLNKAYTVYPCESLVNNIGLSGDSTHGSFKSKHIIITAKKSFNFSGIYLNKKINERFKKHYNLSFYNYAGFLLKKLGIYKPVKRVMKKIYSM